MTAASNSLSPEMEDYLETIAGLSHSLGEARVTDIADHLSVRKASVTQALQTLAAKGLIHYEPYVAPTLTASGLCVARQVQHRHDILKNFLAQVLLVEAELAETTACRLEHAVDQKVLDQLAHFVEFIQRCPGNGDKWIRAYQHFCKESMDDEKCETCMTATLEKFRCQRHAKESKEEKQMTLAELKPGKRAKIVRVGKIGAIRRRIVDMGVVNGTEVTMVKVAPFGDPMEVKVKGYSLTLRREEANAITIEAPDTNGEKP